MKKYFLPILIVLITGFLLYQWFDERSKNNFQESKNVGIFIQQLDNVSLHFRELSVTLKDYEEDFSDREKALFLELIRKEMLNVINIRSTLGLIGDPHDVNSFTVHDSLEELEEKLATLIREEKLPDKATLHSLGEVYHQYGIKLFQIIYEVDSENNLLTPNNPKRIVELFDELNREIEVLLNDTY